MKQQQQQQQERQDLLRQSMQLARKQELIDLRTQYDGVLAEQIAKKDQGTLELRTRLENLERVPEQKAIKTFGRITTY